MTARVHAVALLATTAALFIACGDNSDDATSGPAGEGFPITLDGCDQQVKIEEPPERVVLIGDGAIPLLEAAGALDKVVGLAGEPTLEIYSEATRAAVTKIPRLGAGEDATATPDVSLEEIINQKPDLVIGLKVADAGITQDGLAQVGIPFIGILGSCQAESLQNPGFPDVYSNVELYGRLFGNQDQAATAVADLRNRVAAVEESVQGSPARTAAVLYMYLGTQQPGAYGTESMSDTQLETVGLSNVFADVSERYFEPSVEEIIARNPDVLVLLHDQGDTAAVRNRFLAIPGVDSMTAVRNNDILVMRFEFTDPPNPLSVQGLTQVADAFACN